MANNARFEFQTKMLEKGAEELQRQIGRLDEILFKIKASATTLWIALIGWSLTSKVHAISLLGFVLILGFWILEVFYRGLQIGYVERCRELTLFFNDEKALDQSYKEQKYPSNLVYPLSFRQFQRTKLNIYGYAFISPSVSLLYIILIIVNVVIWQVIKS